MEGCNIENRTENIIEEIEKTNENKFGNNELLVKNMVERYADNENNAKNKLRSKFSYKDKNKSKQNFKQVKSIEQLKQNYFSSNPKKEIILDENGLNSSGSIKDDNIDFIFFKDKVSKNNVKELNFEHEEFSKERSRKSVEKTDFDKSKYHSEKIILHREKYDFSNIKEIMEKQLIKKNDHKRLRNISGDIINVPSLWTCIGLNIENIDLTRKSLTVIPNPDDAESNGVFKSNTHRYEIPRDLEKNFTNNVEPIDKNEAKTVRTKEFVNKIDSNNFEINCKEIIIRDSIRKLSNHESYYEFNNNLEINQIPDKRNNQIPRINNEYIRNELNHQMVQIPFNNIGSTAMLHSNLKLESGKFIPLFYILKKNLDFVISSENLSNKGYVRIETNSSSVIRLPENYWTRDMDKKILVELINETPTAKWEKIKVDHNIKIYKKKIENNPSILIKTIATISDFSKEEIYNAIANVEIRKQWDSLFSEFRIVEENIEEKSEVLYMSLKSPFVLVERRDFVQKRKIWNDFPDNNSVCIHFKSIDHPKCPLYKKIVRAHTYISGYFIKTESHNPLRCSVHIVSQTDAKGKIPAWIVNKVSQTAPNDWVNNLIKGCKMVREKKIL